MLILKLSHLQKKRNLLAFSAGVDSSALFFLLLAHKIPFDIALVNYGSRENSDKEQEHANTLAKTYNLKFHTIKAPLFKSHFEENARKFRYDFFEQIINQHSYDTLLTAHQLDDQLEWLLMRLTKGAGVCELIGLCSSSQRDNYILLRPLLSYSKKELLGYLEKHAYPYFIDQSNSDEKYERNLFRKQFSNPLIMKYKEGIKRSFEYLRKDKENLEKEFETIFTLRALRVIKLHNPTAKTKAADLALKELGYLLSAAQRKEIEKEDSLVIGGKWAIASQNNLLYISPYITTTMPKKFKERCRILKIPSKIRAYSFKELLPLDLIP